MSATNRITGAAQFFDRIIRYAAAERVLSTAEIRTLASIPVDLVTPAGWV